MMGPPREPTPSAPKDGVSQLAGPAAVMHSTGLAPRTGASCAASAICAASAGPGAAAGAAPGPGPGANPGAHASARTSTSFVDFPSLFHHVPASQRWKLCILASDSHGFSCTSVLLLETEHSTNSAFGFSTSCLSVLRHFYHIFCLMLTLVTMHASKPSSL